MTVKKGFSTTRFKIIWDFLAFFFRSLFKEKNDMPFAYLRGLMSIPSSPATMLIIPFRKLRSQIPDVHCRRHALLSWIFRWSFDRASNIDG